ncbi:MAG: hypothetical protein M1819_002341 [Sarea resinae]|nr:MAG: hypothetical protein M1819_002341 [Sarea resinae]
MIILSSRTYTRVPRACSVYRTVIQCHQFHCQSKNAKDEPDKPHSDPRARDIGRAIEDEYAVIRDSYQTPKNPIVLAHGLLGFDELRLAGPLLPGVQYWRGITEALAAKGIEVITASVPASGSIEERAEKLGKDIAKKASGKQVNIIA